MPYIVAFLTIMNSQNRSITGIKCNLCGKSFREKEQMKRHIRAQHLKERTFKCKECCKAYTDSTPLTHHTRVTHGDGSTFSNCSWYFTTTHKKVSWKMKTCFVLLVEQLCRIPMFGFHMAPFAQGGHPYIIFKNVLTYVSLHHCFETDVLNKVWRIFNFGDNVRSTHWKEAM